MIKFIENTTSTETIFEDGVSYSATKTPLIQNLLKPITPLADSVILFLLRPKNYHTNGKKDI